MKTFLKNLILFVLPLVVMLSLFEVGLRRIPNNYSAKNSFLTKKADQTEVLVLGSSHAYFGLNPYLLHHKAYSAAYISQSLDWDEKIYKKFEDKLSHLKVILIPISYFSFRGNLESGSEKWRLKNYLIYYHIFGFYFPSHYFEILSETTKVNMARLLRFYKDNESDRTCSSLGAQQYKVTPRSADDLSHLGREAALRHTIGRDPKMTSLTQSALGRLIDSANKKNIKVILYTSPAYKTYYENLDPSQLSEMQNMAKDFASKDNVIYVDYMRDVRFEMEDFYDGDHLNEKGSEKFSKIIDELIVKEIGKD